VKLEKPGQFALPAEFRFEEDQARRVSSDRPKPEKSLLWNM